MVKTGTISHIALSASDHEKSKKFYSFLLSELLGYTKVLDQPYCTMWTLGPSTICVSPGNQTPHHKANPGLHHLAFCTETHDLIDDLYNKIVHFQDKNKDMSASVILDKPALYPQYGEGYYGVFFTDPDGIKLELCYTPSH